MGELLLRPLTVDDEAAARAAHEELAADDFAFLLAQRREEGAAPETWAEYAARLEDQRHGRRLDPGFVPASFLVAEVDGVIVGRASVRHELNEFLAVWGGHIGYGVRPAYRRRGHAPAILRGCLALCADLGIGPDEVIAFGDMPNDIPMLSWAGRSWAMADAHPTVVEVADEVAPGHEEDGVARVLAGVFDL